MFSAASWLLFVVSSAVAAPAGWLDGAPLHADSPEVAADVSELRGDADWRVAARADAAAAWQADPELAEALSTLAPRVTRAGSMTYAGPGIDMPGAAAVLLDRLLYGGEPEEVRAALARAVAGRVAYPEALVAVMQDPSPSVRASVVSSLVRTSDHAQVLHLALADDDASVREAALVTVERRPDLASFSSELLTLALDPVVPVQVRALRTAVRIEAPGAWDLAVSQLSHEASPVRSAALVALHSADATRLANVEAARVLLTDGDASVRRTAERLLLSPPR